MAEAEEFICKREKPLALYLFTQNKALAERFLRYVPFGGGCINDTIIHLATSRMGFGGVGGSGMGSTNKALASSCKGAKLLEGKVFKLSASADALRTWAESCK